MSMLLAFAMLLAIMPEITLPARALSPISDIDSFQALKEAAATTSEGSYGKAEGLHLRIKNGVKIAFPEAIVLDLSNREFVDTIEIESDDPNGEPAVLTRAEGYTGPLFIVSGGSTVHLSTITLNGTMASRRRLRLRQPAP